MPLAFQFNYILACPALLIFEPVFLSPRNKPLMSKSRTDSLAYAIARLHRALSGSMEGVLQHSNLSLEQWRVLEHLSDREGCAMGDLALTVLMNHPALTKMIDRMVADGLVHRAPDAHDQRRVLVFLSDRGAALYRRVKSKVSSHEAALRRSLGTQNAKALESMIVNATKIVCPQEVAVERD